MTAPAKHPFNDYKHRPTRTDIDLTLGMLTAIELKRLEELIELHESSVSWSMEWYDNEQGWGYRASYRERVLCVIHFYNSYFTVTFAIPDSRKEDFFSIRELTAHVRQSMKTSKPSLKAHWYTIRLWKREDVEAVWFLLKMKLATLRETR